MKKGFNNEGFMAYLRYQFPDVFTGAASSYTQELVENLIEYAHKHEQVGKDQFCEFLTEFLPEVEFGEVAAFMEDGCLTTAGQQAKRSVMAQKELEVEYENGITHVYVEGKELYL